MIATRAARTGCVFTLGALATAVALRPSSFVAASRSDCDTPLMMNEPRLNVRAAHVERFFGGLDVGVLELVAQRDEAVVAVGVDDERAAAARRRRPAP